MKRKMIGAAIAYMSGLFFASFFLDRIGIAAAACFIVLAVIYGKLRSFKLIDVIIISVAFVTAVSANLLYTEFCVKSVEDFYGCEASFSGTVADFDVYDGGNASYVIKGKINGSVKAKLLLKTKELDADLGDVLYMENCYIGEIKSDYLFDSKTWNKSRHIFAEAASDEIKIEKADNLKIQRLLANFRKKMVSKLRVEMGAEAGSFLSGMIFGEKRYLESETRTALYRSGIGHILAVSGLHVSITAALIMKILKRLKVNKFARFAAINFLLITLITLTNYPISAIRAALMLDIMYSAELFLQQNNSLNSLSVAALIICLFDPYAVYSSGFILSLSGTFGIAVFSPYMAKNIDTGKLTGKISAAFVTALCTSLSVMPASMYYFDETSVISPAANVLLVSVCTAAMILGFVYVITGGILTILLIPAKILILAVIKVSETAAHIPYFHIPRTSSFMPILFSLSAAAVLAAYLFGKKKSAMALVLSAVIAVDFASVSVVSQHERKSLKIAVLGRGTDAAAVISCSGRAIIADMSGQSRTVDYVHKYLTENGLNCIDYLILTRNSNASFASYEKGLEFFIPENILESSNENMTLNCGGQNIDIADGTLTLTAEECTVTLTPAKNKSEISSEMTVYYGNSKTDHKTDENNIYLSEMNNFEIIPDHNGKWSIRRL